MSFAFTADIDRQSINYGISPIPIEEPLRQRIVADGYNFKGENLITVVPDEVGGQLEDAKFDKLVRWLQTADSPPHINPARTIYAVSNPQEIDGVSHPRDSLVVRVVVPKLERLLGEAATELAVGLPLPPLYLTLATRPDNDIAAGGIGIATEQEWTQLDPQVYHEGPWIGHQRTGNL